MPTVSIVIPTHNRPEMLEKAVASAAAQTNKNIEVIVVDDGSFPAVTEDWHDTRISIHRHSTPKGASAARNTGLWAAKGAFTVFLDDDDCLDPDYVTKMLQFIEPYGENIDFAWPTLRVLDVPTGRSSLAQNKSCLILPNHAASESSYEAAAYTRTTGMLFRTSSIRKFNGFDESLAVSEDRELIFRMLSQGCGCGALRVPLVTFYIHTGPRLSTNENLIRQATCDAAIAHRHADFIANHPRLASRYLNLLARRQKDAGLTSEYRTTLKTLLKIKPYDVRAIKRLAASLFMSTGN